MELVNAERCFGVARSATARGGRPQNAAKDSCRVVAFYWGNGDQLCSFAVGSDGILPVYHGGDYQRRLPGRDKAVTYVLPFL